MRNLKRALSLALAMVMVLSMTVIGASAVSVDDFSDGADIVNKEAVTVLATLGVITGNDDGSYAPTDTISRAEMSTIICRVLNGGKDPVLGEFITNSYTDTASHWAKNYIEYCTTLGIVAGKGDGTFDPEGDVTVAEAAKMVLVALGYNAGVEGYTGGNWQINTDARANPLGLYDDLDYTTTSAPLTRDNAAQMLYNALDCKMVTYDYIITGNVQDAITTKPQLNDRQLGTLLWEKFGAVKVVGVVVGNEYAVLDSNREDPDKAPDGTVIGNALDDNKTTVLVTNFDDGEQVIYTNREYTFTVATGEAELGKAVYMYVKPASNTSNSLKATVIGSANISDENTIVTDASDDTVADVVDDNNLELTEDTLYAYNYAELDDTAKAGKDGLVGIQKTIVDVDSDGDVDYVLLKEQGLGKVTLYSTAKDGQIVVAIDRGNYVNDDSADIIGFEDVEKDAYVLTAYIGGRLYVQTAETVTGTIDAYKQDDGGVKDGDNYHNTGFTVDGEPYDVSEVFTYDGDITCALDEVDKTILDSDATFYLDVEGNVVAYGEVEETAYKYAYIWGAEAGGSIDTDRVKATLEDGSTKTYDLDDDSEIDIVDGARINDPLTYRAASKDYTIGQNTIEGLVFAYNLTSSGEIKLSLPRGGAVVSEDGDSHPRFTKELTNIRFTGDNVVASDLTPHELQNGIDTDTDPELYASNTYYSNNATTFFYVSYESDGSIDAVDVYNGRNNAPTVDGTDGTAILALNTRGVVAAAVFDDVSVAESAGDHMFVYDANYVWQEYGYVDAYFNGEDQPQENVQVAYVDHLGGDIEHNPDVADGIYLYRYNTDGYYEITEPDGEPYYKTGVVSRVNKALNTFVIVDENDGFKWEFRLTDDSVVVDYDSSHSSPVAYLGGTVAEGDVVQVIINNENDSEVLMVAIMDRADSTTGGGVVVNNSITIPARGGAITYTILQDDLDDLDERDIDRILSDIEAKLAQNYTIESTSFRGTTYTWTATRNDVTYTFNFDVDKASTNWDIYVTVTVNGEKRAVSDDTTIADLEVATSGDVYVENPANGNTTYVAWDSDAKVKNGFIYSATKGFVNATINGEAVRVQTDTDLAGYKTATGKDLKGWVRINNDPPIRWNADDGEDHVIKEGDVIVTNLQQVTFGTSTTTLTGDGSVVWKLNETALTNEEMAAKIFMGADDVLTCTVTTDDGFKASAADAALTATGAGFTITAEVTDEYTGTAPATVNGAAVEYVNGSNYWDGAVTFTFKNISGDSTVAVTESKVVAIS